jgi:hypothetical protein
MVQVIEHLPNKHRPWVQTPALQKKKVGCDKLNIHAISPETTLNSNIRRDS